MSFAEATPVPSFAVTVALVNATSPLATIPAAPPPDPGVVSAMVERVTLTSSFFKPNTPVVELGP